MGKDFEMTITIDPATALARVTEKAQKGNVTFVGDTSKGSFSGGGVKGSYAVKNPTTIVVTVDDKPMLVPWGVVENKLRSFFATL